MKREEGRVRMGKALLFFPVAAVIFISAASVRGEDDIKALYDAAIKNYTAGKYSDAIRCWQRVLEIDSEQAPPKKMIEFTRAKIKNELSPLVAAFEKALNRGEWFNALDAARRIMDIDPTYPGVSAKKDKLAKISEYFKDNSADKGVSRYVRAAVKAYLEDQTGRIFDAVIYAGQINEDKSIKENLSGLLSFFEGLYPEERSKVKLISGMTLLPQLLQSSLDSIYKADYTGAVMECDRALFLEPDNIMALMRKGSAYYAMKNYDEAKKNWQAVLKIEPDNKDVIKFLKALKKQEEKVKK